MIEIASLVFGTIAVGFVLGWLTPAHPLTIALGLALAWAVIFGLAMMLFAAEAWPLGAGLAFGAGLMPSGIGAFLGWLKRTSIERASDGKTE